MSTPSSVLRVERGFVRSQQLSSALSTLAHGRHLTAPGFKTAQSMMPAVGFRTDGEPEVQVHAVVTSIDASYFPSPDSDSLSNEPSQFLAVAAAGYVPYDEQNVDFFEEHKVDPKSSPALPVLMRASREWPKYTEARATISCIVPNTDSAKAQVDTLFKQPFPDRILPRVVVPQTLTIGAMVRALATLK